MPRGSLSVTQVRFHFHSSSSNWTTTSSKRQHVSPWERLLWWTWTSSCVRLPTRRVTKWASVTMRRSSRTQSLSSSTTPTATCARVTPSPVLPSRWARLHGDKPLNNQSWLKIAWQLWVLFMAAGRAQSRGTASDQQDYFPILKLVILAAVAVLFHWVMIGFVCPTVSLQLAISNIHCHVGIVSL